MKYFLHALPKSFILGTFLLFGVSAQAILLAQSSHNRMYSSSTNNNAVNSNSKPAFIQDIGINEKLGTHIPAGLSFAKANGDSIQLVDLLSSGNPVILNLLYYECPVLCGLVIDGLIDAIQNLAWQPGKEFDIISVSIDPTATDNLAARVKQEYIENGN